MHPASEGWPWGTIWAAISALATVATFIVATWALFRWRKQDELKIKGEFKKSISIYKWYLDNMPERMEYLASIKYDAPLFDGANKCFFDCFTAWEMSEGLINNNTVVRNCWDFIRENHNDFLNGLVLCSELKSKCDLILNEKFVFK